MKGVDGMNINEEATARIIQLCKEKNLTLYALARNANIPPSTIYNIVKKRKQNISIVLIKKLCDGLGITLTEFFASKEFSKLDQKIK